MHRKFREWLSVRIEKQPGKMVLSAILLFNILFFLGASLVISSFALDGTENMSFIKAAYCTITMILDAGCISFVVEDIGQTGVGIAVICLIIIVIGMISFTGAVIGYITNLISSYIDRTNAGSNTLCLSGHTVVLNWNTRASEIINDLLYCDCPQRVVVLAGQNKAEIEKEIEERLTDTVNRENEVIWQECSTFGSVSGRIRYWKKRMRKTVTVIVREGDVFSSKQLHDICVEQAATVIILGSDINNTICKLAHRDNLEEQAKGNSQTIKTLMQVADMTAAETSADHQKIVVEISDAWTGSLVDKIIKCKQVDGKCRIVPIYIHEILGQILSQFSLMPELNLAYSELFSNKGTSFYTVDTEETEDRAFIPAYLKAHADAVPLTIMEEQNAKMAYFAANSSRDIQKKREIPDSSYTVKLNPDYWIEKKSVVILGHNSKCRDIMRGFCAFRDEWNYRDGSGEILQIVVIDEEKNLKKMDNYREYPFVIRTVAASIYDRELICDTINWFIEEHEEDTSILILSDDSVQNEDIDANVLANLVYIQDIINNKVEQIPDFDVESIDVIAEIIDPKHYDVVSSYSKNNVVISNRYISKMITQIGENEALFKFYQDILTYDAADSVEFESKEVYTKEVDRFFNEIPEKCTACELIRAVYAASVDETIPKEKQNPSIVLGYVKKGGRMCLFGRDQEETLVKLESGDKLIVFSNH